ncbi:MAG: DUF2333 family protein [Lactobacillaceae bacterium]|jgi:hypothetical protein|nr:DUF2333 family protein [Lactobacillaceae bacterium]
MDKIINFLIGTKNFLIKTLIGLKDFAVATSVFVASWWRGIIFALLLILFLYYPIGAFLVNNIDRNTDYNFAPPENHLQSQSVEIMSYIIDREVNQKTWTPNLPFFFPSAILDNMPNFQLGMFDALSDFSYSFRNAFPPDSEMKSISEFLSYNGKIWMFSPENKITPISSANKMYRDGRKKLKAFNQSLADNKEVFNKRPADLAFILKRAGENIAKSIDELEEHINEEKNSYTDTKSDDVFFYNQGKLYAYYLLLNAVGQDYKDLIVANNLYTRWAIITKSLADASNIAPLYIRDASLNSIVAPNHLNYLALYALKADNNIQKTIRKLETATGTIVNDY